MVLTRRFWESTELRKNIWPLCSPNLISTYWLGYLCNCADVGETAREWLRKQMVYRFAVKWELRRCSRSRSLDSRPVCDGCNFLPISENIISAMYQSTIYSDLVPNHYCVLKLRDDEMCIFLYLWIFMEQYLARSNRADRMKLLVFPFQEKLTETSNSECSFWRWLVVSPGLTLPAGGDQFVHNL